MTKNDEARVIMDGRLEVHSDGSIYKVLSCGIKKKAVISINNKTRQATIRLNENGKQQTYSVNRLIAETFLPNPENKPYVRYINGNPSSNCVDNLMWVSKSEQIEKSNKVKEKDCSICGGITYASNGICTTCKKEQKLEGERKQRMNENLEQIKKEFANVVPGSLTYLQKKTLELRLRGMTYEEIGCELGCSRQCIDNRIKSILEKSGKISPSDNRIRKLYISAQNRLNKKVNLLNSLNIEVNAVKTEILALEHIVENYGGLLSQEM